VDSRHSTWSPWSPHHSIHLTQKFHIL
jgi:hypothetical protein